MRLPASARDSTVIYFFHLSRPIFFLSPYHFFFPRRSCRRPWRHQRKLSPDAHARTQVSSAILTPILWKRRAYIYRNEPLSGIQVGPSFAASPINFANVFNRLCSTGRNGSKDISVLPPSIYTTRSVVWVAHKKRRASSSSWNKSFSDPLFYVR